MPRAVLIVIAALSLGFAPVPFPKPPKQDPSKADLVAMQGNWVELDRP